ncbi:MAG: dihydroorotase [Synergistetes bacterium]|nr:dihydroorotase [Synergistota bacterium]
MKLLIKNGIVVDETSEEKKDLLIEEGKIAAIEDNLQTEASNTKVLDATGMYVLPGFVDMHTHLRIPGQEKKEDVQTGTLAALKGGFTTITCMPNTSPPIDTKIALRYLNSEIERKALCNVLPTAALTKGLEGKEIVDMVELKQEGAIAFSDDGVPTMNAGVMRNAMLYSKVCDALIMLHCEDKEISKDGDINDGKMVLKAGLKGIPSEAEEVMLARNIMLAKSTGARIHISHVSTKNSVKLIEFAKNEGVNITAEVTPHHLTLTEDIVSPLNPNTKVYPPLRTEEDIEALIYGLKEGIIDAIATDHAPHTQEEKSLTYHEAPFGISGIEIAFSVINEFLINRGIFSLSEVVKFLSTNPAKILSIENGIAKGRPANLTIISPEKFTVDTSRFASKGKNSPFDRAELSGIVEYTIINGDIKYRRT